MVDVNEYLLLRSRPSGRVAMTQRWRSLLFMHFPTDPMEIQKLLPSGLTVDTFPDSQGDEKAWIGLVPFRMEGVTLRGLPEIPRIHAFPETNVRTYVHRDGKEPGVWFFSLEAANSLACRVARRFFHLPYYEAHMTVSESGEAVSYRSTRRSDGAICNVDCLVGAKVALPIPGSLEFFLVERYLLYSSSGSKLYTGRVFHSPYELSKVELGAIQQNLIEAAGIVSQSFEHVLFSERVDVEVFGLRQV